MSEDTSKTQQKTQAKTAETPKHDSTGAAAHNPFAFDPMAMWTAWQNPVAAWTQAQTAFQNQMHAAQAAFQNALSSMTNLTSAATGGTNPFAAWTQGQASVQKMMGDSYVRAQAWSDEYAAQEAQMTAKAHGAIDTWAQLAHDTINYTAQLSAQARKLSFDAARKAGFAGA
jgi:hypothetical protein